MRQVDQKNDFYDFGPAIQNDRTDTSMSAEIEVYIYEIKCFS